MILLCVGVVIGFVIAAVLHVGKDADKVEVVRCRECKYREDHFTGGLWCNHPDNRNPLGCRPNDYCNDGVRSNSEEVE